MPFLKSEIRTLLSLGLLLPALAQAAEALPPADKDTGTAPTFSATNAPLSAPREVARMGPSISMEELEQNRGGSSVNSIRSEAVSNGLL